MQSGMVAAKLEVPAATVRTTKRGSWEFIFDLGVARRVASFRLRKSGGDPDRQRELGRCVHILVSLIKSQLILLGVSDIAIDRIL